MGFRITIGLREKTSMIKRCILFAIAIVLISFGPMNYVKGETSLGGDLHMKQGAVFFATDPDKSRFDTIAKLPYVNGAEYFVTWGDIEKEEGVYDWSKIETFADTYRPLGKKIGIRLVTASFSINDSPAWLFNKYNVRRIAKGYWLNVENGLKGYELLNGTITTKTDEVIAGKSSIKGTAFKNESIVIATGNTYTINSKHGYSIQFDCKGLSDADFFVRAEEIDGVRSQTFDFSISKGEIKTQTFDFNPDGATYKLVWGVKQGEISLDNLNIIEAKSGFHVGTLCYPNYFDPIFKEKFANFIKAFGEKYKDDATVDTVSVGGYGRWEEMTLCKDDELFALEDQWVTNGYSDNKYIDHVKWCVDTYKKYLPNKQLIMCSVGFPGADTFKDQRLVDWKVNNYIAKNGVALKYNGWQTKCSEWAGDDKAIFYLMNRYKYTPGVKTIFEEGAQVNIENAWLSEIMGNPLSLLNRAVIDGIDNYWLYWKDIQAPHFAKYIHYANEAGGKVVVTKLYTNFGAYPFPATVAARVYTHYNQSMGLYHIRDQARTKVDFTEINGVKCVRTNEDNGLIALSLDDRQKYNGMYGSVLSIDYFDQGLDNFEVYTYGNKGNSLLGKVKKTNTKQWKTVSFYNTEWTNQARNSGKDVPREIEIDDCGDGLETVRNIEINYVPARAWLENIIQSEEPAGTSGVDLTKTVTMTLDAPEGTGLSGISLPVEPQSEGYINLKATVYANVSGSYKVAGTKEYFMPESGDWLYVPIAAYSEAKNYKIELKALKGKGSWLTSSSGKTAYRLHSFIRDAEAPGDVVYPKMKSESKIEVEYDAQYPFYGVELNGQLSSISMSLAKKLPDGTWKQKVVSGTLKNKKGSNGDIGFEPQTAGKYKIILTSKEKFKIDWVKPLRLKRIDAPTEPVRNNKGKLDEKFKSVVWKPLSGFKAVKLSDGVFSATLAGENPSIHTTGVLAMQALPGHQFKLVIKNQTSSNFVKVFWKTGKNAYSDTNSCLIPLVPNDTKFREYSWPIGLEAKWKGVVTGMKVELAHGHTDTGVLDVYAADIRIGTDGSMFNELLDIKSIKKVDIGSKFLVR